MVALLIISVVKVGFVAGVALLAMPFVVLFERKLLGWIQVRPGPNRVGPWGLFQSFADGIKLFFKEEIIPEQADKPLYLLAPMLSIIAALVVLAIIPFGPTVHVFGRDINMSVTDLNIGILFFFAIASLGVYGIVMAGWSSNNKYSLLGGIRSSAQMLSYEISLGLSVAGVLLLAGTFDLRTIAQQQAGGFWNWYVFQQPLGFVLFMAAGFAETNRLPFDLPEAESELTGGYHTEYSSMKFAMFFISEYINIMTMSAIVTTLYLGGWTAPIQHGIVPEWVAGPLWFGAKVFVLIFLFILIRGTWPRLRYDQLMAFGWKIVLPLAFVNIILTACLVALDSPWWVLCLAGLAAVFVIDRIATMVRRSTLRAA
jgi:NADH-quinone oxidoreductase subunit H